MSYSSLAKRLRVITEAAETLTDKTFWNKLKRNPDKAAELAKDNPSLSISVEKDEVPFQYLARTGKLKSEACLNLLTDEMVKKLPGWKHVGVILYNIVQSNVPTSLFQAIVKKYVKLLADNNLLHSYFRMEGAYSENDTDTAVLWELHKGSSSYLFDEIMSHKVWPVARWYSDSRSVYLDTPSLEYLYDSAEEAVNGGYFFYKKSYFVYDVIELCKRLQKPVTIIQKFLTSENLADIGRAGVINLIIDALYDKQTSLLNTLVDNGEKALSTEEPYSNNLWKIIDFGAKNANEAETKAIIKILNAYTKNQPLGKGLWRDIDVVIKQSKNKALVDWFVNNGYEGTFDNDRERSVLQDIKKNKVPNIGVLVRRNYSLFKNKEFLKKLKALSDSGSPMAFRILDYMETWDMDTNTDSSSDDSYEM